VSGSGAIWASVAVAAGVCDGTRFAETGSSQPAWLQVPSHRTRPGSEVASVVCPSEHVPRTRTRRPVLAATTVDAKGQVEVHCYADVGDTRKAYELSLAARDELIVEAIDVEGMSQKAVADLAGVAKGRISAILAGSQPDVVDQ
jgi:hypothetical protein